MIRLITLSVIMFSFSLGGMIGFLERNSWVENDLKQQRQAFRTEALNQGFMRQNPDGTFRWRSPEAICWDRKRAMNTHNAEAK